MKKSEINVSMPMTTYEEFLNYKKTYEELLVKMNDCFNLSFFQSENTIIFDTNKAFELCKSSLQSRYKNANFNKID